MASFAEILQRFHEITGTRKRGELADALGITFSSISEAERSSAVPPWWYVSAMHMTRANPAWLKTGRGPKRLPPEEPGAEGSFAEIYDRIGQALNVRTQSEMSDYLHVRSSSISEARWQGIIPPEWYLRLIEEHDLNPEWLKKGVGCMYLKDALRRAEGSAQNSEPANEAGPAW